MFTNNIDLVPANTSKMFEYVFMSSERKFNCDRMTPYWLHSFNVYISSVDNNVKHDMSKLEEKLKYVKILTQLGQTVLNSKSKNCSIFRTWENSYVIHVVTSCSKTKFKSIDNILRNTMYYHNLICTEKTLSIIINK